ncbi:unnamed protein product [Caenorhabditis angaria]|uniref:Uncharacterized protein n=1 Tax=Caenorhabditis angaria TaxID=860376 RepID=A0A9P1N786_9PELO|nr:unnamed protein product [Caenorhabditis angaria]
MATNVAFIIFFLVVALIVILILDYLDIIDQRIAYLWVKLTGSLTPLLTVPSVLHSVVEYKKAFFNVIPFSKKKIATVKVQEKTNEEMGAIYFDQFKSSWA